MALFKQPIRRLGSVAIEKMDWVQPEDMGNRAHHAPSSADFTTAADLEFSCIRARCADGDRVRLPPGSTGEKPTRARSGKSLPALDAARKNGLPKDRA